MPKIAFIGAGSAVFTRNLVGDILSLPELRDSAEFALMDIDAERLRTAELLTERLIDAHAVLPNLVSLRIAEEDVGDQDYAPFARSPLGAQLLFLETSNAAVDRLPAPEAIAFGDDRGPVEYL